MGPIHYEGAAAICKSPNAGPSGRNGDGSFLREEMHGTSSRRFARFWSLSLHDSERVSTEKRKCKHWFKHLPSPLSCTFYLIYKYLLLHVCSFHGKNLTIYSEAGFYHLEKKKQNPSCHFPAFRTHKWRTDLIHEKNNTHLIVDFARQPLFQSRSFSHGCLFSTQRMGSSHACTSLGKHKTGCWSILTPFPIQRRNLHGNLSCSSTSVEAEMCIWWAATALEVCGLSRLL